MASMFREYGRQSVSNPWPAPARDPEKAKSGVGDGLPVTRPELRNTPTIRSMAVSLGEFGLGSEVGVDVGDIQVSNRDLGTQFRATALLETWGTRRN
jgi:hypothetical protein